MSGDIFGCHNLGWVCSIGISCVKARDAARHPIMHGVAPTAKNDPAPDVNGAAVEKLL